MVGRATGDDHNPIYLREVEPYLREIHGAASVEASGEGRPQGGGLLVDLLEHVVLKHAELDSPGVPVHLEALSLNWLAVNGEDPYRGVRKLHDLPVLHEEKPACLLEQSLNRARQKILALSQAQDQRALVPGGHYLLGLACLHRRDRERAL